jgi:DNA-binding NarL/FixJ family response regulator
MCTRILLADDHALLRNGLRRILESYPEFCVVAEAASGTEAVTAARDAQPDVAIVDIGMPGLNGIEATSQILRHSPLTAVLILSMHGDARYVLRAMKAGASGYLLKDSVEEDLLEAIRAVRSGQTFFSPAIADVLSRHEGDEVEDRYDLLTGREREVYRMLAEGKSNKEIACLLSLSLHTVETHRNRIMEKLRLHSAAELVLSAVERGLVGLP